MYADEFCKEGKKTEENRKKLARLPTGIGEFIHTYDQDLLWYV